MHSEGLGNYNKNISGHLEVILSREIQKLCKQKASHHHDVCAADHTSNITITRWFEQKSNQIQRAELGGGVILSDQKWCVLKSIQLHNNLLIRLL